MANQTVFGMEFVDPEAVRRKQAHHLQKQLAGARSQLKNSSQLSGFGIGAGLSAIAQRFAPKTAEEQEAQESSDILGEVMGELELSGPQDPNSLPAAAGVEFANVAREKFFDAGDYKRAAFFAEKQQEKRAEEMAQRQLHESTEEMIAKRADTDAQHALDDQKILVTLDKTTGRPSLYNDPAVNGGDTVINGATTPEGVEGIESQINVAQQLGHTVIPMSLGEYAEAALDFEAEGFGLRIGTKEQQKMRDEYRSQTDALSAMMPLAHQLVEDPQALQGLTMKPDGTMKQGLANSIVSTMQNYGEQWRRVQNISDSVADVTVPQDGVGGGRSVKSLVSEGLQEFGISNPIAQARVIGLAYAIARARDSGGRLSDQDVALALRSLTGQGSAREISILFGDMVRGAKAKIQGVEALISNQPAIVSDAQRKLFHDTADDATNVLNELYMTAGNIGQAKSAGEPGGVNTDPTPGAGAGSTIPRDVKGKVLPLEPDELLSINDLLDLEEQEEVNQ